MFPMIKMPMILKRLENLMLFISSLKLSSIHLQVLKVLRNRNYQQLTGTLETLKTSRIKLQIISLHRNSLILMNFLQWKMIHCMWTMHLLTLFNPIQHGNHVTIFLEYWKTFFVIQFNLIVWIHIFILFFKKKQNCETLFDSI